MNWTGGRKSKINTDQEKQKQRQHFQKIRRHGLSLCTTRPHQAHLDEAHLPSISHRSSRSRQRKKKGEGASLKPQSHLKAALSSATLQSLEQDAQHESWRPFHGVCIEDIGVKVERDPYIRDVYHKTVVDPEKFQRARRYCSNMLVHGLFDWRGEEYQLRYLPQEDQATTATRSIPDDDSVMDFDNHKGNDSASDRGHSFSSGTGSFNNGAGSLNNYTSNTFKHKLSMTKCNKEHTNHVSTHNDEPSTTTVEQNRIANDAKEVRETMEEDEDELIVPSKHLANCQKARELLAINKNEKTTTTECSHTNHLERSLELDDSALENTSPLTPTVEIMSEILSWTRSTVSDDWPTPAQRPTSPVSPAPFPQFSSPVLSPVHNAYAGSTQEQLDILFKDMAPSPSPKSLLGSEDWLELRSDVE